MLKIIQQPFNYYLLIGLLIIGFFFRLDYSDRFGCIRFEEPVFETKNILFSVTSMILVLLSFFSKKRTIKLTFISLELLFWTAKLFLFKGGYVVNILGTADLYISLYDTATLALRLFIIVSLLEMNIKHVYIFIFTTIIMSIKIYFFPLPYSFYIQERKFWSESENTKNFLTKGKWVENINATEKIRVVFFHENAVIYNLQNKDRLSFNVTYWTKEFIHLYSLGDSITEFCIFEFQVNGEDTLNVNFIYNDEDYKTQMIRKVAQDKLNLETKYKFEDFPAEVYSGKLSAPDFNNNSYASSMGFVESMTYSCESEGINFGGRFTILQGGCGNMCSFIIMADRETGQFVTIQNPDGYDEFGAYGYEYRKDSRLLISNAMLFADDEFQQFFPDFDLKPKYYVWDNNEFVLLE